MNEIALITGMAVVTYLIRIIIFPISKRVTFPDLLQRALSYVPPVVLTAIIVPAVLIPDGATLFIHWRNPYLAGAAVAALIGWFTRNLLLTILFGMAGFWLCQAMLG